MTDINGNLKTGKKFTSDFVLFNKIINRLYGLNGSIHFNTRRYKNSEDKPNDISKCILIYISIPVTKNVKEIEDALKKEQFTVSQGKVYLEKTKIDGIYLLTGVKSVHNLRYLIKSAFQLFQKTTSYLL